MAIISLKNMQFFAHHGCFEAERATGTHFEVDLSFETNTTKAEISDEISDTVNYQHVYHLVKAEMAIPSNLLEHVARRIANAVKREFVEVSNLNVAVRKMNPPLGGQLHAVEVKIT